MIKDLLLHLTPPKFWKLIPIDMAYTNHSIVYQLIYTFTNWKFILIIPSCVIMQCLNWNLHFSEVCAYVHSVMSYGIIFWGNSHHSINIFKSQKRIIRIMTYTDKRDRCHPLFKKLQILPFPSQYIFSLLTFVVNNRHLFLSNSAVCDTHTHHNNDLHLPSVSLSLVQKGVLYSGCKIYNHFPSNIKNLSNNVTLFKSTLKKFSYNTCSIVWMNIIIYHRNDYGSYQIH